MTAGVDTKQRRGVRRAVALLVAVAVMCMAVPSLAATAPTAAQLTTTVVKNLPSWGTYAVVVSLGKTKVQETANVYVGSQVQRDVALAPWSGAEAAFYVHVKAKQLRVLVVGTAAPVKFKVAVARQVSPPASQPTASSYASAPSNPYTKLVWSDEFNGAAGSRLLGDSGRSGSWRSASPGTGDRHDRGVANPIVSSEAMRNANAIVALSS
jgi:hypothetical protein